MSFLENIVDGRKRAWLRVFSTSGVVADTSRRTGIAASTHYQWRWDDPAYEKAYQKARIIAGSLLEDELVRRGRIGFDEPVYQGGKLVGNIRRYSDVLLIVALKALDAKYRDRVVLDIEDRIRQVAEELGVDIEAAVAEARLIAGKAPLMIEGKARRLELPARVEKSESGEKVPVAESEAGNGNGNDAEGHVA